MKILDFNAVKNLDIPAQRVYDWCNEAWKMKRSCILPPKMKAWQGDVGRYITMPCIFPELDVAGVKFISRNIDDSGGIPARNSNIMIQKCSQMGLLAVMDGIWITNMRTGAIAAHSVIEYSKSDFRTLGLMGLGNAARSFMYILGNVYPRSICIKLMRYKDQAESFIDRFKNVFPQFVFEIVDDVEEIFRCDSIVSAVSFAHSALASGVVFAPGTLIVPIHQGGFQNCDLTFEKIIIDDFEHVKSFRYYEDFKNRAIEVSDVVNGKKMARDSDADRVIVYCGGLALHDIYIAYQIYKMVENDKNVLDVTMKFPEKRFWI